MVKAWKPKLFISEGTVIGRLYIGPVVANVKSHELLEYTPPSYLRQGRLHEVICDCGNRKLISESILASGRVKSCGCLGKEINAYNKAGNYAREKLKLEKKQNLYSIRFAQAQLKNARLAGNSRDIESLASDLRRLFGQKAALNRASARLTAERLANRPEALDALQRDPEAPERKTEKLGDLSSPEKKDLKK